MLHYKCMVVLKHTLAPPPADLNVFFFVDVDFVMLVRGVPARPMGLSCATLVRMGGQMKRPCFVSLLEMSRIETQDDNK